MQLERSFVQFGNGFFPQFGQFGERSEAHPGIFAAFVVVGGGRQQVFRVAVGAEAGAGVKGVEFGKKVVGFAADLVTGGKRQVAVKGGVLDALRCDRRGELLKTPDDSLPSGLEFTPPFAQ